MFFEGIIVTIIIAIVMMMVLFSMSFGCLMPFNMILDVVKYILGSKHRPKVVKVSDDSRTSNV